jgi:hypothetical protein
VVAPALMRGWWLNRSDFIYEVAEFGSGYIPSTAHLEPHILHAVFIIDRTIPIEAIVDTAMQV